MITITLRQMAYFEALAETRHFGRAAELSKVSQPALSTQIAEIENRLGVRLFERTGRAALLTADGARLKPLIERALADAREIEATARLGRDVLEGRFRLGIIPTIAPYILPSVLSATAARFPRLTLEIREAVTGTLIEETASGGLDALLAADPLDHPSIATLPLFKDRFFLAASAGDKAFEKPPVAPESPLLERLMLLEEGHCLRDQALALCGEVKPVAMASYGATSLGTLLQMVAHGLGVTLVPEMALPVEAVRAELRVVPFTEPQPFRTICLGYRRSGGRESDVRALGDMIAAGRLS
ncbi:MAG: hydrogen peroxide-inducible genes activator [Phyllobacteriaceae bacterium]|nr:hydrogen peroxide-inducible genes activator [Phyllobacteriaceae bacterium]